MRKVAALVVILVLSFAGSLQAQSESASLTGRVTDPSKAIIPDAKVVVINMGTNFRRETTTNESGIYYLTNIQPSTYRIEVEKAGFRTVIKPGVILHVQDTVEINFEMTLGSLSESITVEGGGAEIDMSPSVGTVIDQQFVGNLPLNGRSFQTLILLTPGVVITNSAATSPGQFSVNGQRADANYFTVDGVSANLGVNQGYSMDGSGPGLTASGGTNNLVSIDALEEFKIQTSTFSAEFGRQPGGQVSMVTRSGKNRFHGTVFEDLRNDVMDAREYFNTVPAPKPPMRQNQFGGTFGGPVFIPRLYDGHDRTFFFFAYEGQRLRLPQSGIAYVPSLSMRQSAAAALQPIFKALPLPNGTDLLNGWAAFNYSVSDPGTMDTASIRIDHTVSSKLTLFGRYNDSSSNRTTHYYQYPTSPYNSASSSQTLTIGATAALRSGMNNELRLNWSRQRSKTSYVNDPFGGAAPISQSTLISGYDGPGKKYSGATINLNGRYISLNLGDSFDLFQRQINLVDNVSLVKGKHQFKFGVDYRRMTPTYGPREYYQSLTFSRQADIESGTITSLSINAYPTANLIYQNLSVFSQDHWTLLPRLTMDLGLRWELNPSPREASGRMPITVTGIVDRDASKAVLAPAGSPFYKTFYNAFAPRFGLAYQLRSTSGRETVLRGGFGVYHALGSGQASMGFAFGFPNVATKSQTYVPFPVPSTLLAPPSLPEVKLPISGAVYSLNPDLSLPYSLQWNVALEQSLGTQQSISLSYVASAARRLLMTQNINAPAGYTYGGARPNPNFQYIYFTANGPTADYHSLQAQYKAHLRRGLQALLNYTWSHAIDEVSNEIQGYNLERGNANFDVRHNLSAAITYDFPKLKGDGPLGEPAGRFARALLNNWSVDAIVHAQSGRPLDVTGQTFVDDEGAMVTGRPDVVSGVPFYISDPSVPGGRRFNSAAFTKPPANPTYPGLPARQGNFGRNVLTELPLYQTDLGVRRNFNLSEKLNLQFKAEAFNVFNHPLFGGYGTSYTTPSTFGVPAQTLNRALGGLNSLYQMGGPRSIQLSMKLSF